MKLKTEGIKFKRRKIIPAEPSYILPEVEAVSNVGNRESQQDSFGMICTSPKEYLKNGMFVVAADGMGGLSNGDEASHVAVSVALEYFKSVGIGNIPHRSLLEMTEQANKNVLKYVNPDAGISGSTLVATYIRNGMLWFVTVGDSRLYLMRGRKLIMLNREHIYARELDIEYAKGKLSLDEADSDKQRSALTDYIGKEDLSVYDFNIKPVELMAEDSLLLMSDGVFNTLNDDEIVQAVAGRRPQEAVSLLQKNVLDRKKPNQDNFTCVYIKFSAYMAGRSVKR